MTRNTSSTINFYILLSLIERPLHGYGIIKQVAIDSEDSVRIGAGTLYTAIDRLLNEGYVKNTKTPAGEDKRRIYYAITPTGKEVIETQIKQMRTAQSALKKYGLSTLGAH